MAKRKPTSRTRAKAKQKPKPQFGKMRIPRNWQLRDSGSVVDGGHRDIDSMNYWSSWDGEDEE